MNKCTDLLINTYCNSLLDCDVAEETPGERSECVEEIRHQFK